MSNSTYINIPATAGTNYKDPIDLIANLPATGNQDGDTRLVKEDHNLYVWDGSAWQNKSTGGGGTGVTSVNTRTGTVVLSASDVGLANVDNTSDANKPISTATQTALNTKVTGPASATDDAIARFDLATGKLIQNSLATIDDAGNLTTTNFSGSSSGVNTGDQTIVLSGDASGSGTGAITVTLSSVGTSGTYTKITTDTKGRVTAGTTLSASDIPSLDFSKISTGIVPVAQGGTNSNATLLNNRIIISNAGAIVESAAITANKALASNASGIPVASSVTDTELSYVSGVTSAIQTQLNSKQSTLTIGNLTDVGTDGITITGGTGAVIGSGTSISQHVADATHNGYLASADFITFSAKQPAGNYITSLTSDVSASGPGAAATTVNSVGGSSATNIHSAELLANAATNLNTVSTIVKRDSSGNFTAGTITAGQLIDSGLTINTVPYADGSKQLTSSAVTPTELGYLSGVTSAIQTQINNKFTLPSLSVGSILFSDGTTIIQDNTNFFWDNTNHSLSIGPGPHPATSADLAISSQAGDTKVGLSIFSTSTNNAVQISNQNGFSLAALVASNANSPSINFERARGTLASKTQVLAGDILGSFVFNGYTGSADGAFSAAFGAAATENQSSGHAGAQILFQTTPNGSSTLATRLTINQDGTINIPNLTASRALATDGSSTLVSSATTSTELGYVSGVTSAIQTQLNGKQAIGNYITATSGDVVATGPGSVAATIQSGVVSNSKLATMAAHTFKGNNTSSIAAPLDLTQAQLTAELVPVTGDSGSGGVQGVVPAPASGSAAAKQYLKASGNFATIFSPTTSTWAVYVDKSGSDSTGDGGPNNPYLTITAALNAITDATNTKRYTLFVGSGRYTEDVVLKPFIWVQGYGVLNSTIAGAITIDPTMKSVSNSRTGIRDIYISGTGTITVDLTGDNSGGQAVVDIQNVWMNGSLTYTGRPACVDPLLIRNVLLYNGGSGSVTIANPSYLSIDGLDIQSSPGNFTFNFEGLSAWTHFITNLSIFGNFSTSVTAGTNYPTLYIRNSKIFGSATNGANVTLVVDDDSLPTLKASLTNSGTITAASNAQYLKYEPGTSGDWNTAPTLAGPALDTLASSGIVKSQSANIILASPSGSSGLPTFRALTSTDIAANLIDDSKIRLTNNNYLRSRNAANSADINILKVDGSDTIQFASLPQVSADATTGNQLVRFSQVQSLLEGLKPKEAVRVASTADVTIASALINGVVIDGVTLATGDRVLLKDQVTASQNGIYLVAASGAASRSLDMNASSEFPGAYVLVREGTANQAKGYVFTVASNFVLGVDSVTLVQFSSSGSIVGGDMITVSGTTVSVDLATTSGLESTNPGNVSGQLRVKLEASNPSLKITGSNELGVKLDAAGAIASGASGIATQVDASTIEINTNALRVKDAGITLAKLASLSVNETKLTASVAGSGLTGGAGSALAVNVDNATLEINANTVRVKDLGITTNKLSIGTGASQLNAQVIPANYTATNYTPVAVGTEGTDKISSHLKGINNQLGTISLPTDISLTSFTAADNQASAANVTGLAFSNASVQSFEALVTIVRNNTYAQYKLNGLQKAASWEMSQTYIGDDTGITFTITTAGQIQYVSSSTGFTATVKFRAITSTV